MIDACRFDIAGGEMLDVNQITGRGPAGVNGAENWVQ
jgi:hypothetical protein